LTPTVDVAVIGAGVAGLATAACLASNGLSVVVFEEGALPRHRVCGEYVSLEVLPFIRSLGLDVFGLGAKRLTRLEVSSKGGRAFRSPLDLGGFGLSRYRLDAALLLAAQAHGARVELATTVKHVEATGDVYRVHASQGSVAARLVLGCFGKRSKLDHGLARPHTTRRTPYVAIKRHYRGSFPSDVVGLHVVPGGYCGISAVEDDMVNVCCLTDARHLKANGGLEAFERDGLRSNPLLAHYLAQLTRDSSAPLTVSQVDFGRKGAVHEHVLMLGDAAGLIHPLAGNGMAMALRSAATVSALVTRFFRGGTTRARLETAHTHAFRREFRLRLQVSRVLQQLFESTPLSEALCATANALPALARFVIRSTHGSAT
jgi:flavin-dependent dehydrogenase